MKIVGGRTEPERSVRIAEIGPGTQGRGWARVVVVVVRSNYIHFESRAERSHWWVWRVRKRGVRVLYLSSKRDKATIS